MFVLPIRLFTPFARSINSTVKLGTLMITCALSLVILPSHAGWDAHLGVESEYVRNGISQTHGRAAPQAGFGYHHQIGAYTGLWASNIDQPNTSTHSEWSPYAGWYIPITGGLVFDAGVTRYVFKGDRDTDEQSYNEIQARLLVNDGWTFGAAMTDNYYGSQQKKRQLETAYTFKSGSFAIEVYLAQQKLLETSTATNFGSTKRDDYWHFRFALERTWNHWDYRLKLERTNLGHTFDAGTIISLGIHKYFDF